MPQEAPFRPSVYTIGHSTRPIEEFIALLREPAIEMLVDVRAIPGSRHNPQFGAETLRAALAACGIAYRHMPELGGRRRGLRFALQWSHHRAGETEDDARSGKRDQLDCSLLPRLESHRGSRGDVETKASRRGTIERQRSVGFREVIMRAHLDRPVAGVCDRQPNGRPAGIELDLTVLREEFTGNHGIGWCTVTSLVPSGNVAST